MTTIRLEKIIPKGGLFDEAKLMKALDNTVTGIAKDIKVDLDASVSTFSNAPKAKHKLYGRWGRDIYLEDERVTWLNDGTRVRYATMTPGFVAKSVPRTLASRPGRGGVLYVNRNRPRPGIKAREWDKTVADKWQKLLPGVVERMVLSEL